jgi:predicted ATPase/class 3 adenylate cyclase
MVRKLPSGLVTFLMTDIEGSTRLFTQLGEAYPPLLERHNQIIREAVARHEGVEVKTEGDAFLVAFSDASRGVAAAVDAQRALAAEDWPFDTPILVRMAVHAGDATPSGGDYVSIALHACARFLSTAHGGQIVASQVVQELVGGNGFEDAGKFRLRDLPGATQIFHVRAEGLPRIERALRAPSVKRNNIPNFRSSFIGRERECVELAGLIKPGGCVTVVGLGGAGKTRLAYEVADRIVDDYPDGVWVAELAHVLDPTQVAETVANVIGAQSPPGVDTTGAIVDALVDKQMLIVLDNSEHVLDACVALVDAVLDGAPTVAFLATSRQPLGVEGELLWRLPVLGIPSADASLEELKRSDSVALFLERAKAALPSFELRDADVSVVSSLCRRLDGIPLALELAAARVRALTPAQIEERLDDRFRLLVADRGQERHQTLRATIDWSYDLLSDAERDLLDRLSIFAGSFVLEAADAIAGEAMSSGEIASIFADLVDKSLVVRRPGDPPRFLLLDTIRAYAREQLDSKGRHEEVRRAHIRWMARRAVEVDDVQGLPEAADFRAAFEHALSGVDPESALPIAVHQTHFVTDRDGWASALRRAVEGAKTAGVPLEKYLPGLARWARVEFVARGGRTYDDPDLIPFYDEIEASIDLLPAGHARSIAIVSSLGRYRERGDTERVEALRAALKETCEALDTARARATLAEDTFRQLAEVEQRFEESLPFARQACNAFMEVPDMPAAANMIVSMGDVESIREDHEAACRYYRETIALLDGRSGGDLEIYARFQLAKALRKMGDLVNAAGWCRAVALIAIERGNTLGNIELERGNLEHAARLFGMASVVAPAGAELPDMGQDDCRERLGEQSYKSAFADGAALQPPMFDDALADIMSKTAGA